MQSMWRIAVASLIGTAIEFYDFFLYGAGAALIFNRLFFPTVDPLLGTMAAFATFGVGFLARPLGALVFGNFGDRIGRRTMLVLSLLITGVSTALVGVLPTYQQVGILAPVLLVGLRFLQGIGLGGEWGGAVLLSVEHAPQARRGFFGSLPQVGAPAGLLLANAAFAVVAGLPEETLLATGWRIPFVASLVLVLVGLFVRRAIPESPDFQAVQRARAQVFVPAIEALRSYWQQILLAMGASCAQAGCIYMVTTFMLTYATQSAGLPRQTVLLAVVLGGAVQLFGVPVSGALSDRLGYRRVFLFGGMFAALMAIPLFRLIDAREPGLLALALIAGTIGPAAMYAPLGSLFATLFQAHVRYSGLSLGYQLGTVLAGGLSPLLATLLLAVSGGNPTPISVYMISLCVVSVTCVLAMSDTAALEGARNPARDRGAIPFVLGTERLQQPRLVSPYTRVEPQDVREQDEPARA